VTYSDRVASTGDSGVPEARIAQMDEGALVETEGWFVLNVADALWVRTERAGDISVLEPREAPFPHVGVRIQVLRPGQANAAYHSENQQEDFLVLSGECICLIEGEERRLKAWDFVHCPPETRHVFVGAGDGPCAILMFGARLPEEKLFYPKDERAAKHDASAPEDTNDPSEAYRDWPDGYTLLKADWPPET
jgi:uncharacterized cupin superfamily protein